MEQTTAALIIVEDNVRYAATLVKGLKAERGISVRGIFSSAEKLLGAAPFPDADVALLDIGLPGMDGIELVRKLKGMNTDMELLMLTAFEDEERLFAALKAGASGFLVKRAPLPSIAAAVMEVADGGTVISPALARRFCNYFGSLGEPPARPDPWGLEPEERELLEFTAKGLTNSEVGGVMGLKRRSVRTMLGRIYKKMGTNSRVEAIAMAVKSGSLSIGGRR